MRCRSRRCGLCRDRRRGAALGDHETCLTPIGRQLNPIRHNGIDASVERRIEARARGVEGVRHVTA